MSKFAIMSNRQSFIPTTFPLNIQWEDTVALVPGEAARVDAFSMIESTPMRNLKIVNVYPTTGDNIGIAASIKYDESHYVATITERATQGSFFPAIGQWETETLFSVIQVRNLHSSTKNYYGTEEINKIQLGSSAITNKLTKFSSLKRGWDSYNAVPMKWPTIIKAMDFFSNILFVAEKENKKNVLAPFIAPLADGGIQFEWRTCYKELTIIIPEEGMEIEYLKIEKTEDGEKEESNSTFIINDIIEMVTDWLV